LDALVEAFPGYPRASWLRSIEQKQLLDPRAQFAPIETSMTVSEGARFVHILPGYSEPTVSDRIEIVYEDDALVVINKGAPLPVHPSGRFNRNTLSEILADAYHPEKIRPCHRLDMNTTGLIVFARKYKYARRIQEQFRVGKVEKIYLATVEGRVPWDDYLCTLGISADPLPNGGRALCEVGMQSQTRFRVLDRADDMTRLEAVLLTGRTHQIRLHLAALGFPVLQDPLYLPGGTTREIPDEERMRHAMGLHAWKISFEHPITGKWMTFEGI
jgi:RluA family pseudouridine synthase